MNEDGGYFLEHANGFASNEYHLMVTKAVENMGVADNLCASEISLLCEAVFLAALCNIAFNGRGGCGGRIKPERESTRRKLEQFFMVARDEFFATAGWIALPEIKKRTVQSVFLKIIVAEENLAR